MKKLFTLLFCALLALTLVGCGNNSGSTTTTDTPTEWVEATSREVETMDYVVTALASDHEINANLVDGLLENDRYGHLVGALAETWDKNDDATVWTFNLRKGVKWVTNTGEEYAEVTADDFVTGLRHGAEFDSGTSWLLMGVIKGYSEYLNSDFSDAAWEQVGIKAIDEYTVEYTMETSVPYFDSMTTYAVLYPVNRTFLESKGTGCVLGAPNKEACEFGTVALDSILYNGGYILTTNDSKSSAVLTKNEAYWDAENVHLTKVTRIYDGGEDPYSVIKGFEQGTYVSAGLSASWEDYDSYVEKYADNAFFELANPTVFGVVYNFNRQIFEETEYAEDLTLRQQTRDAILNTNFRKALQAAFDRTAYLAVSAPEALATATLRNVNNFPEAGLTSDGVPYFDLVEEAYTELTGEVVNLEDGQDPWLNKDKALAYIEAAKAEGVVFPVHLDMLVVETSDRLVKQANSMKQSVSENTDGQIIIELVLRSQDVVEAIAYDNMDPYMSDYDISTFTGWSPDYADPKSFVDIYSPTTGYYMTSCGLGTVDGDGNVEDLEVKEKVGFMEYERLYREADAITDDMDARYKAFAKADAYLIANVLFAPGQQQTRSQLVQRVVPFTRCYSTTGISEYKYKGAQLQNDVVTVEQYEAAKAEWEANR